MTIRDLGLSLVRKAPGLDPIARRFYRLLPAVWHDTPTARLRRLFATSTSVTFVQIGAYDGHAGDPIHPLVISDAKWRGVTIEPQPGPFAALIETYHGQSSRIQLVNAAVDLQTGERSLFVVSQQEIERHKLPGWLRETASFDRDHILKHLPVGATHGTEIEEIKVPTVRFGDVAGRLPGSEVDLVVIDVEGYERPIIESIDLDRHKIRCILYERKHLGSEDQAALLHRLRHHGFQLKSFGRDTLAWRQVGSSLQS